MKKITLLVIVFLSINLYSEIKNDISWYKCLKGKIGNYPVTMHLHKYDKTLRGYYYYDKYSQPISLFGDVKDDSVMLGAGSNNISESFKGVINKNNFKGTWNNSDKNTSLEFDLAVDGSLSGMFEYVYVYGTKQIFRGWDGSPQGEYTESSVWPTDKYPNSSFIRTSICDEKKFPAGSKTIGELMLKNKNNFFAGYMDENKDLKRSEIEKSDNAYMYSVTDEDNMIIAYFDNKFFVISRMYYTYAGGAHGNYGTGYTVYDLVNKKKLAVSDILTVEGIKNMPLVLEKNFRKQYSVDDKMTLEEYGLFVDTIPVNDNFILTPGGMAFNYVPYEIGSYAGGEVTIYIPMEDIEKYLVPQIKKLL